LKKRHKHDRSPYSAHYKVKIMGKYLRLLGVLFFVVQPQTLASDIVISHEEFSEENKQKILSDAHSITIKYEKKDKKTLTKSVPTYEVEIRGPSGKYKEKFISYDEIMPLITSCSQLSEGKIMTGKAHHEEFLTEILGAESGFSMTSLTLRPEHGNQHEEAEDVTPMLQALNASTSLTHLDLNSFYKSGFHSLYPHKSFLSGFRNTHLRKLSLTIESEEISALGQYLNSNSNFTELSLCLLHLDDKALTAIGQFPQHIEVFTVNCDKHPNYTITFQGMESFAAEFLANNTVLRELYFLPSVPCCKKEEVPLDKKPFYNMLMTCTNLERLIWKLNDCKEIFSPLTLALKHLPHLKYVEFGNFSYFREKTDMTEFLNALKCHPNLIQLGGLSIALQDAEELRGISSIAQALQKAAEPYLQNNIKRNVTLKELAKVQSN